MTNELRDVLTEDLAEHREADIEELRTGCYRISCGGCGWRADEETALKASDAHDGHLADMLLALPGVAVIQLPTPSSDEYGNTTFADGVVVSFRDGWTQLRLEDIGRDDCYDWDDDQLREFGTALIAAAAAVVAEGEDNHA